ncbi:MAG: V-type ATP synthase subunit D [Clostridia bacterium]|nr:V-type ATP synthase subunit D [Clostridia bacterium]
MRLNVNPTRMELSKLKARLKTATRGHKLLKDKTDEMIRKFSDIIREDKALRDSLETEIAGTLKKFSFARTLASKSDIELAFSMPAVSVEIDCGVKTVMNVPVPALTLKKVESKDKYPYSFGFLTGEADVAVDAAGALIEKMVKLAELEKSVAMLADEIEKSKRRVNALEYFMIPNLQETIKYISMKLEENDRSSRVRLMKVKSMMLAESSGE